MFNLKGEKGSPAYSLSLTHTTFPWEGCSSICQVIIGGSEAEQISFPHPNQTKCESFFFEKKIVNIFFCRSQEYRARC